MSTAARREEEVMVVGEEGRWDVEAGAEVDWNGGGGEGAMEKAERMAARARGSER